MATNDSPQALSESNANIPIQGNPPDPDLTGKLFSGGFSFLGISFPLAVATLGLLRNPNLSSEYASSLENVLWGLLPAILLTTVHMLVCLCILSGKIRSNSPAIYTTILILLYLSIGLCVWVYVGTGGL